MSINEIEEKFNLGQLIMFSQIQKVNYEEVNMSNAGRRRGRIINKSGSIEERNKNAWKYL